MKRRLIIDALESGHGRTALLSAADLLWRIRRFLPADVIPVVPAESGYSPCGEEWTANIRMAMRDAYDRAVSHVQPAVRHAFSMLPLLSQADEAMVTAGTLSMGMLNLLASSPTSSNSRSWIITSSAIRSGILREATLDPDGRIVVLGPRRKRRTVYASTDEAVQPTVLTPDGILVVSGSAAMSAALGPVVARLRTLAKHDIQFIMTDHLPSVASPMSLPAELAGPSGTSTALLSDTRIMERIAVAVGRDILLRGISQSSHVPVLVSWLRSAPPRLVIVGNDRVGPGAALVCAARHLGIPSLCVQDGMAGDVPNWWIRLADWTATNGAQLRDILVSRGVSEKRIVITGQPRYDALSAKYYEISCEQARTAVGVCGESLNPVILVILQDNHDTAYVRELLAALLVVMRRRALTVIIRPHPGTTIDATLPREMVAAGRLMIDGSSPVPIALRAADAVIGQYSTMLIEAVLMGIPAVVFLPSPTPTVLDLAAEGVAYASASTREELINRCMAILDGPVVTDGHVHAAEHLVGLLGNNAADRVARLALEIVASR